MLSAAAKPVYPLPRCTIRTHTLVDRTATPAATILAVAYDKNLKKLVAPSPPPLSVYECHYYLQAGRHSPVVDDRRWYRKTRVTRCIIIIVVLGNDNGENIRDEHPRVQDDETQSSDAFWLRKRLQFTSHQLRRFLVLNPRYNNISFTNILFCNNKIYGEVTTALVLRVSAVVSSSYPKVTANWRIPPRTVVRTVECGTVFFK